MSYNPYPLFESYRISGDKTLMEAIGFTSYQQLVYKKEYSLQFIFNFLNHYFSDYFWSIFNSVERMGEGFLRIHETLAIMIAENRKIESQSLSSNDWISEGDEVDTEVETEDEEEVVERELVLSFEMIGGFLRSVKSSNEIEIRVPHNFMELPDAEKRTIFLNGLRNSNIPNTIIMFGFTSYSLYSWDEEPVSCSRMKIYDANYDFVSGFSQRDLFEIAEIFATNVYRETNGLFTSDTDERYINRRYIESALDKAIQEQADDLAPIENQEQTAEPTENDPAAQEIYEALTEQPNE